MTKQKGGIFVKEIIKEKYGSVDKLIKATNTNISRSYLYQIISGHKIRLSIDVAKELTDILELESMDKLMDLLNEIKKYYIKYIIIHLF